LNFIMMNLSGAAPPAVDGSHAINAAGAARFSRDRATSERRDGSAATGAPRRARRTMRMKRRRLRSFIGMRTLLRPLLVGLLGLATAQSRRAHAQRSDAHDKPPVLTAFSINANTDTVSAAAPAVALVHTAVGTPPAEYRVSHRADFAGASWTPYETTPAVRDWYEATGEACSAGPSLSGRRVTFYFQVRAALGEEVRIVNGQRQLQPARAESNVLRATICAVGSARRA
jgi:hypothetical protein